MKSNQFKIQKITVLAVLAAATLFQSCKKKETEPETPVVTTTSDITGTVWTSIEASYVAGERMMGIGSVNGNMILTFLDFADPSLYYLSGQMSSGGQIAKHPMNITATGTGFEKIKVVGNEVYGIGSLNSNGVWVFDSDGFTSSNWNVWSPIGPSQTTALTKLGGEIVYGSSVSPYVNSTNISFPDVTASGNVRINAMIVYNGNLICAGEFDSYNGTTLNNIAAWNGTDWTPLGDGVNGKINELAIIDGDLVVGGLFSDAGGNTNCENIAKWNGSSWEALGTGLSGANGVLKLFVYESQLFVGGDFNGSGGVNSPNIIKWQGGNWIGLPTGISVPIGEIGVYENHLYIANAFNISGGNFLKKLE